jgi:hypothetical protein
MFVFVKIFSFLLGLMVISKTYLDYKKKSESFFMFVFWTLAWIGIITVSLFPEIIDQALEISRAQKIGTGTFFGISIIFLFFVIYRIYIKANKLEKKLHDMVMKLGLEEIDDEGK